MDAKKPVSSLFRTYLILALGVCLWVGALGCPASSPQESGPTDASTSEASTEKSAVPDVTEPAADMTPDQASPEPTKEPASPDVPVQEPAPEQTAPDQPTPERPAPERPTPDQPAADADCSPVAQKTALNIAYDKINGVEPNLLSLDLVVPARQDGCALVPVVVWVHGGGWSVGDKQKGNIQQKASFFLKEGYALVSINYRLTPLKNTDPNLRHPVHIQDVAKAFAWIHANIKKYGGDPSQIAALGHSAGAHLVALLSTDESYLKTHNQTLSMIRCTGSFDTEAYDIPGTMKTADAGQTETYSNAFGKDPKVWADASPITHVARGKGIPPFLFAKRGAVARRATLARFVKALNDAGIKTQEIDASSLDHAGVNNAIGAPGDTVMTGPIAAFLKACFARP